jgi:DNA (cytosine-5)-methyltransferase 1
MNVLSLFSGIGTTEIMMHSSGWETVAFCEIDPFARLVLTKRFPGIPIFKDVTKLTGGDLNGRSVDLICGGFPCQDLSVAGQQRGLVNADGTATRSGLWFEYLRLIRDIRPRYVLAENVRGAVNLALDTVTDGLHRAGYEVRTLLFPACACGAPHQRERIFIIGIRADLWISLSHTLHSKLQGSVEHGTDACQGEESDDEQFVRRGTGYDDMENTGSSQRPWRLHAGVFGAANEFGAAARPEQTDNDGECRRKGPGKSGDGLATEVGGRLNPDWVECLQGLPIGWTDLECETPVPWPGWPAPPNAGGQYEYEPPRTARGVKNGAKRLRALGNCNPPQQYQPAILFIKSISDYVEQEGER